MFHLNQFKISQYFPIIFQTSIFFTEITKNQSGKVYQPKTCSSNRHSNLLTQMAFMINVLNKSEL